MKVLLCLLFTAPLLLAQNAKLNDLSVSTVLGGPEILEIVKTAKTITAQRVDSKVAETEEQAIKHPELIILDQPITVTGTEAEDVRKAFTSGATYLSPSKTCVFRANVRYAFILSPERKVEFVLCFGCGELEVWHKGDMVSFGPFDGGYANLLDVTKRIFPKDEFIAAFDAKVFEQRAARMREATPTP